MESEINKIAIIADRSTAAGFRLAGVQKVKILEPATAADKLIDTLLDLLMDKSIKFVLITEPIVDAYGLDNFEKFRRSMNNQIIIIVIPDSKGSRSEIGEGHLWKLIQRAIGRKRST